MYANYDSEDILDTRITDSDTNYIHCGSLSEKWAGVSNIFLSF
jgi:hypothetical protein